MTFAPLLKTNFFGHFADKRDINYYFVRMAKVASDDVNLESAGQFKQAGIKPINKYPGFSLREFLKKPSHSEESLIAAISLREQAKAL